RFLDLYAGTGAVALEALSRGAAAATFVERDPAIARVLRANCARFDLEVTRAAILVRPVAAALRELARTGPAFELAWADPPFASWQEGLEALVAAFSSGLLAGGGLACLECPAKAEVAGALPGSLEIVRDLKGGASRVVMIRKVGV
ncbi:MAG: RsmD family RNA methyltransferase, partial [Thermoanaerobaculales bacterium]|nr:RsmD family RNA methyltransferase [Thermoanaerobaculales bacterium]